jgi:hypothetical protein
MAHLRGGSFIRRAKDITVGSALALALFSGGILMEGCGSSQDEDAYTYEETTYKKGIRSYISEVKPGEFKIMNEESVPGEKSEAIVSYLDGHSDTLSAAAAKTLIDEEIRTNPAYVGHHSGLSTMLLYGGLGYMLGRNNSNGYINNYRDRGQSNTRGFYANPGAYSRSQSAVQDVHASRTTRTVTSRPRAGRSGFFSRSAGRSGG